MSNELMYKAKVYSNQIITSEWMWSEKLDGRYFLWDGGVSRGMNVRNVPWANTLKDSKYIESTGLWSSHGKVIHAPDSVIDSLPPVMLDGELYCGRGTFQKTMSITRRDEPSDDWNDVQLKVFGCPTDFMRVKRIDYSKTREPNMLIITRRMVDEWIIPECPCKDWEHQYEWLKTLGVDYAINEPLGANPRVRIKEIASAIVDSGGEGIMIRAPWAVWTPGKQDTILKVKPFKDAEGTVIGHYMGEERLTGLMGGLVLDIGDGKVLRLGGGFNDSERSTGLFPIGTVVTFKYREMSDDGIPKEARYWRKR